jgi:flagellar biosynthesis anti-sigma factor FlgM
MKIDNDKQMHLMENLSKSSLVKTKNDAANTPAAKAAVATKDKVELSGWKDEVNRLKEKVKALPDVRMDKVAEAQEALKAETYNIKGELVARKILQSHLLDEIF